MSDEIDPTSHDPEGRERLAAALDALGVDYELFPCDPALADTAAFCAAYGFEPEDSANTIVVIGKGDPPRYAACVVLAPNRLDVNRTVRDRLGTRKASFAPAETTRDITGMEIGGVTVFGLPAGLPIWVDGRVMRRERIILGGGSRSWKVLAAPSILSALQASRSSRAWRPTRRQPDATSRIVPARDRTRIQRRPADRPGRRPDAAAATTLDGAHPVQGRRPRS